MILAIGFFAIHEIIRILDRAGSPVDLLFPYTIGLWIMLSQQLPLSLEIGIVIFLVFVSLQTFNEKKTGLTELLGSFFAGAYVSIGLLCAIMIHNMGTAQQGFLLTMMLVVMVWGNDVFAYFGGKTFGKHPLAKHISPNKTWEGFFSGYVGSLVGGLLIYFLIPISSPLSIGEIIPMALLVGTFGPIGDLLESKLKRKAGVKDSSNIIPGHGGFFDRFDAFILAAPAMYIYIRILERLGYISL